MGAWNWTTLGQFVAIVVPSALTAYVLFRSRTPALLKDELQVTRERCGRIESENKKLVETNHAQSIEIASLQAKTDLSAIQQTQEKILAFMEVITKTIERLEARNMA